MTSGEGSGEESRSNGGMREYGPKRAGKKKIKNLGLRKKVAPSSESKKRKKKSLASRSRIKKKKRGDSYFIMSKRTKEKKKECRKKIIAKWGFEF